MRIVLEGADGTGKTTLANILAFKYGLTVCHCTQNDASDPVFYSQVLRKEDTVWDRHTIGELIYPRIFGRKQQTTPEQAKEIVRIGKNAGVKFFVLTLPLDELKERMKERPNEHPNIVNNLETIDHRFRFYAQYLGVPVIDTSKMTLQEIFDLVEENKDGKTV